MTQRKRKLVSEIVGGEPYEYYPLGDYIVRAVGVCRGQPTFKYTRIEITGTLERLAAGESFWRMRIGTLTPLSVVGRSPAVSLRAPACPSPR